MKVYSASEAVWPALLRTYDYLFRPWRAERFFRLAAVATLSEGFLVSFRWIVPHSVPFSEYVGMARPRLLAPEFLPVAIAAAMAIFLAGIYCFYLVTQLRFGFVHSLIHRTTEIDRAARLYGGETERFFTGAMLVWLALMVVAVLALVGFVVAGYGVVTTPASDGKLDPGNFLILFVPCFVIALALLLAACAAQVVLYDFILPHMAVEGTSFRKAWKEARARMAKNKETFTSYFILRLGMPLVAGLVLGLAGWLLGLAVFGLLGMSAGGFEAMLDGAGGVRAWLLPAVEWIFALLGLGAWAAIAVTLGGPLGVFVRSYALMFYGGHYKALGNLLEPSRV